MPTREARVVACELTRGHTRSRAVLRGVCSLLPSRAMSHDELSSYEMLRKANILDNRERLRELGIQPLDDPKPPPKLRPPRKPAGEPSRNSARLSKQPRRNYSEEPPEPKQQLGPRPPASRASAPAPTAQVDAAAEAEEERAFSAARALMADTALTHVGVVDSARTQVSAPAHRASPCASLCPRAPSLSWSRALAGDRLAPLQHRSELPRGPHSVRARAAHPRRSLCRP